MIFLKSQCLIQLSFDRCWVTVSLRRNSFLDRIGRQEFPDFRRQALGMNVCWPEKRGCFHGGVSSVSECRGSDAADPWATWGHRALSPPPTPPQPRIPKSLVLTFPLCNDPLQPWIKNSTGICRIKICVSVPSLWYSRVNCIFRPSWWN